jgi:hypothetical protein
MHARKVLRLGVKVRYPDGFCNFGPMIPSPDLAQPVFPNRFRRVFGVLNKGEDLQCAVPLEYMVSSELTLSTMFWPLLSGSSSVDLLGPAISNL